MYTIGLDIGTTTICGILMVSATGTIEKVVNKSNDTWLKGEEWEKIQSPELIIAKIDEILAELSTDEVDAIGVTGQMHGILYYDNNGNAVSPLYTWQDGRGNLYLDDKTYAQHINSHTGYGNTTHFYNRKNGLIPENASGFCTIHDYVVMHLTKRKKALVHTSDAASFGKFDLETKTFTLKDDMHPEITDKAVKAGYYQNIPVSVAIGDNQASFIGGGCDRDTVLCNVGTGSQISLVAQRSVDGLETRPFNEDKNILVGSSLCGGRAYAILEKFFLQTAEMLGIKKDSVYGEMAETIANCDKTDMIFNTLFSGNRENPDKKASVTNISEDNFTPANLIYSCLEGICNELYEMYIKVNIKCTRLVGTGNGIRKNCALKKIFEEKFNMKMQIPIYSEEAAVGAALFALVSCGKYNTIEDAERIVNYENI